MQNFLFVFSNNFTFNFVVPAGLPRLLHAQSIAKSMFGFRLGYNATFPHIFSQVRYGNVPLGSGAEAGTP